LAEREPGVAIRGELDRQGACALPVPGLDASCATSTAQLRDKIERGCGKIAARPHIRLMNDNAPRTSAAVFVPVMSVASSSAAARQSSCNR
jgi:hypothetical protein